MSKTIKNIKRNRYLSKTQKYYGGDNSLNQLVQNTKEEEKLTNKIGDEEKVISGDIEKIVSDINKSRKPIYFDNSGVLDVVGSKISDVSETATDFVKEKALRLFGLQTIDSGKKDDNNKNNETPGVIGTIANNITNDLEKAAAATVINLNEVLKTPEVQQNLTQSSQDTLKIGNDLLSNFNNKLNDPQTKVETAQALKNVGEITQIAVDVLDKPIDRVVDKLNEAGNRAASGLADSAVDVITDAASDIPVLGTVIDAANAINSTTSAVAGIIEAASLTAQTFSEFYINAGQTLKTAIKMIREKKNEGNNIANRTNEKIQQFQNPTSYSSNTPSKSGGGFKKSKKRFIKRNTLSKKVRLSL